MQNSRGSFMDHTQVPWISVAHQSADVKVFRDNSLWRHIAQCFSLCIFSSYQEMKSFAFRDFSLHTKEIILDPVWKIHFLKSSSVNMHVYPENLWPFYSCSIACIVSLSVRMTKKQSMEWSHGHLGRKRPPISHRPCWPLQCQSVKAEPWDHFISP